MGGTELKTADVIVCQLRRDFLASDFCVLTEPDTALRRKGAGEAELIAYVLKDCRLETASHSSRFCRATPGRSGSGTRTNIGAPSRRALRPEAMCVVGSGCWRY